MLIYFELFLIEFKIDRSNWTMDYVGILYEIFWKQQIDGLLQEKRNSVANALQLRFSCTNPWRYFGNQQIESDKTTSIYNVSTRVLSKK